jgi:hypothetical protein
MQPVDFLIFDQGKFAFCYSMENNPKSADEKRFIIFNINTLPH